MNNHFNANNLSEVLTSLYGTSQDIDSEKDKLVNLLGQLQSFQANHGSNLQGNRGLIQDIVESIYRLESTDQPIGIQNLFIETGESTNLDNKINTLKAVIDGIDGSLESGNIEQYLGIINSNLSKLGTMVTAKVDGDANSDSQINIQELLDNLRQIDNGDGNLSYSDWDSAALSESGKIQILNLIDTNNDGNVNTQDIESFVLNLTKETYNQAYGKETDLSYDLNSDGLINKRDKDLILESLSSLETEQSGSIDETMFNNIVKRANNQTRVESLLDWVNRYKNGEFGDYENSVSKLLNGETLPSKEVKLMNNFRKKVNQIYQVYYRGSAGTRGFIDGDSIDDYFNNISNQLNQGGDRSINEIAKLNTKKSKEKRYIKMYQRGRRINSPNPVLDSDFRIANTVNRFSGSFELGVISGPIRFIEIPSTRNLKTYFQSLPPQHIQISIEENEGKVLNQDGNEIENTSYKLYDYSNEHLGKSLLIIEVTDRSNLHSNDLFFLDKISGDSQYIGTYRSTPNSPDLDLDLGHWQSLAKFMEDPLSLNQNEYNNLLALASDTNGIDEPTKTYYMDSSFSPFFFKTLIQAIAKDPSGFEDLNINPISKFRSDSLEYFTSQAKLEIHKELEKNWDNLPLNMQEEFLIRLSDGNSESLEILTPLLINLLENEPRSLGMLPSKFFNKYLSNLDSNQDTKSNLISSVLEHLDVSKGHNIQEKGWITRSMVDFLGDLKGYQDLGLVNLQNFNAQISDKTTTALKLLLAGGPAESAYHQPGTFRIIFSILKDYINDEYLSSEQMNQDISSYIEHASKTDYSTLETMNTYFALSEIHSSGKIDNELTEKIEDLLLNISDHDIFRYQSMPFIKFTDPEKEKRFVNGLIDWHLNGTNSSNKSTLSKFTDFIESSDNFANYASDTKLINLIGKHNPKSENESETEYNNRLQKIEDLLLEHYIFLKDPSAMLVDGKYAINSENSNYIDLIRDVAEAHPKWMRVLSMKSSLGSYASGGNISWADSHNISTQQYVLIHEAAHAMDHIYKEDALLIDTLKEYWYSETNVAGDFHERDGDNSSNEDFPSSYARKNLAEYYAEFISYWHKDSKRELSDAISNYNNGFPASLNQYLFIGAHMHNEGAPDDQMVLYEINKDTGLLEREFIQAQWLSGDMKSGEYEFIFEGSTYVASYDNYKIADLKVS